jgi:hypothetical protein
VDILRVTVEPERLPGCHVKLVAPDTLTVPGVFTQSDAGLVITEGEVDTSTCTVEAETQPEKLVAVTV